MRLIMQPLKLIKYCLSMAVIHIAKTEYMNRRKLGFNFSWIGSPDGIITAGWTSSEKI